MAKARPRFEIRLKPGQDVEKGLRILKKKYVRDGFFKELRMKDTFEKGSDKKIRKKKEMIANTLKKRRLKLKNSK